jgi:hypothetical protein
MVVKLMDYDRLLSGSIDMHLHPGTDAFCRIDALETARQARQARMKAIVIKDHFFPTAPLATMVNRLVPDFNVIGSICLDYEIGGLNAHAVEHSAKAGARVVWMPTFSSATSRAKMRDLGVPLEGQGFSILDSNGKLLPEIDPILAVIKKYDMVLASGHMSPAETFALEKEARRLGINKFIVTHPLDHEFFIQAFNKNDLVQLAENGAFIECTFIALLASEFRHDPAEMVDLIRTVGAGRCIVSTDLGLINIIDTAIGSVVLVTLSDPKAGFAAADQKHYYALQTAMLSLGGSEKIQQRQYDLLRWRLLRRLRLPLCHRHRRRCDVLQQLHCQYSRLCQPHCRRSADQQQDG